MIEKSRLDHLALHFVPGIGSVMIRQLISHFGNATAVWQANRRQLMSVKGFGPMTFHLLKRPADYHQKAEKCLVEINKYQITLLFHSDKHFPKRLRHIPDAPSLLFFKGNIDLNSPRMVAIVGTRKSTAYGRDFTIKLINELKKYNSIIISGLAYGIDINAHRQSLNSGTATVAVMAGGLDRIYPGEHRKDVAKIIKHGAIVTEHPPGTTPEAHNFPSRNRIIAGMSDAVVVIEAGEKGGAQITARLANEYNREVFALPGPYHSQTSTGCHQLIKTHRANLISSAEDIAYMLNWKQIKEPARAYPGLSTEEKRIITVLKDHPEGLHIDQLCWTSNLTVHQAAIALVSLECHKIIRGLPGNRYKMQAY